VLLLFYRLLLSLKRCSKFLPKLLSTSTRLHGGTSQKIVLFIVTGVKITYVLESSIFWDITPCNPLKVNRRFGGTCLLHLRDRKITQAEIYFPPALR
jgi:hypothetical protein